MISARTSFASLACLAASGCAVGPTVQRPDLETPPPAAFVNAPVADASTAEQSAAMPRWWEQIDDASFGCFVDTLLAQNLSLQEATERLRVSRAQPCGWSDLGTPSRVGEIVVGMGRKPPVARGPTHIEVSPRIFHAMTERLSVPGSMS